MPKYADYIKRIEIDSLWSGKKKGRYRPSELIRRLKGDETY